MKSTIKALVLLFAFSIICSSFSAFADSDTISEDYYGTYNEGMYVRQYQINKVIPLDKPCNWDFKEGFKYWGGMSGKRVIESAQLLTEGNTNYVKLIGDTQWDGIITPLTLCNDLKVGQQPCIVYDWKGNQSDFQVYLAQWIPNSNGSFTEQRLGLMGGAVLHEAANPNEWNTSVTSPKNLIKASDAGNDNIYISIGIQTAIENAADADARIANLRLCIMNVESGRIYDMNGNLVKSDTYEYKEDKADYEQALEGFEEYYKKLNAQQMKEAAAAKKKQNQSSKPSSADKNTETVDEDKSDNSKTIILVVCISAVVIAICAVAVTAVMFKKPSKQTSDKKLPKGE